MARKTDTRERLLAAAISVIESEGESALRVQDIADAVGVTKPSIYHFFGDREGLIDAALAEMYRRDTGVAAAYLMELVEQARTTEEFSEALRLGVASVRSDDAARRRSMLTKILGAATSRPSLQAAIRDANRDTAARNAQIIDLGRAKGFFQADFDTRVGGLFASALFTDRHYVDIDDGFDGDEWDALVFETLRHLLLDDVARD